MHRGSVVALRNDSKFRILLVFMNSTESASADVKPQRGYRGRNASKITIDGVIPEKELHLLGVSKTEQKITARIALSAAIVGGRAERNEAKLKRTSAPTRNTRLQSKFPENLDEWQGQRDALLTLI